MTDVDDDDDVHRSHDVTSNIDDLFSRQSTRI